MHVICTCTYRISSNRGLPQIEARGMTLHVEGTHWVAASMTAKREANYDDILTKLK